MVSIFADAIYQETQSFSVTDGQLAADFPDLNFGTVNVDTSLGGFTYVERLIYNVEFTPQLSLDNTVDFIRSWGLSIATSFQYDNSIDLFEGLPVDIGISNEMDQLSTETYSNLVKTIELDAYLDVPADFTADCTFNGSDSIESVIDATIDAEFSAIVIGRQP